MEEDVVLFQLLEQEFVFGETHDHVLDYLAIELVNVRCYHPFQIL